MSLIRRFNLISLLFACVSSLPAIASQSITETTAKIRIVNNYMIVVPVTINGSGPYDFLVDTGSTNSMVDQRLAGELALRREGETTVIGFSGSMAVVLVHADSLSIAGAPVASKNFLLSTYVKVPSLPSEVRGVLGEDYLQNFDVLIDYRRQVIQLESGLGSMAESLKGEHLPIEMNRTVLGETAFRHRVVSGHISDLGDNSLSLLIDSGANNLTLFRENLGTGAINQPFVSVGVKSARLSTMETRIVNRLSLGKKEVYDLLVVAVPDRLNQDVDGLMPTSLFHSIFISHRGRFVILNPSFSRQTVKAAGIQSSREPKPSNE
jgi:predicted aspartyl protease